MPVLVGHGRGNVQPQSALSHPRPDPLWRVADYGVVEGMVRTVVPEIQGVVAPDQLRSGKAKHTEVSGHILASRSSLEDAYADVGAEASRAPQRISQKYGPCPHKQVEAERPLPQLREVGHDHAHIVVHVRGP